MSSLEISQSDIQISSDIEISQDIQISGNIQISTMIFKYSTKTHEKTNLTRILPAYDPNISQELDGMMFDSPN